jgi:hypothetical protein
MTARPILFSAAMIRALLDGRKTQTRRIIKPQPDASATYQGIERDGLHLWSRGCVYGKIPLRFAKGDRLWVRETWRCNGWASDVATIFYRASENDGYTAMCEQWPVADHKPLRVEAKWASSLHMPRWASRLTLTVTDVRVQRVHDLTEAEALAEGVTLGLNGFCVPGVEHPNKDFPVLTRPTAYEMYAALWDVINGSGAWCANPWIAALTFSVERRNIDQ